MEVQSCQMQNSRLSNAHVTHSQMGNTGLANLGGLQFLRRFMFWDSTLPNRLHSQLFHLPSFICEIGRCSLLPARSFAGGPRLTPRPPTPPVPTKCLYTQTPRTIPTGESTGNSHPRHCDWDSFPTCSILLLGMQPITSSDRPYR